MCTELYDSKKLKPYIYLMADPGFQLRKFEKKKLSEV